MKGKIVVLSPGRCGTRLLIDALNQHSAIRVVGELFNHSTAAMPYPDLSVSLFGYRPAGRHLAVEDRRVITNPSYVAESLKRSDGFKLLYDHLDSVPNEVGAYLKERPDVKLVQLVRRDLLARHVSQLCAVRDDKWHLPKDGAALDQSPIEVEPARFRSSASNCIARERFYTGFFGDKARTFTYEDLASAWQRTTTAIQTFIGVPPERLSLVGKKSITKPMHELVANYDELRREFSGTELSRFFEEAT